jgi:opacity protein-like surface antigen
MRRWGPGLGALAAAAIAAAACFSARAADIAPAPGYYPPQQVYRPALYDWTGIYFGGHLGAGLMTDTVTQNTTTTASALLLGGPFLNAGTTSDVNGWGVLGGAQLGVNYEFAPWVVGAEAAFTSSAISARTIIPTLSPGNGQRSTDNPQWFVTATGRFGYAANTVLFYAKGGGAWMHAEYTQDTLGGVGTVIATQPLTQNRTGFVVGGGIEYGMTEQFSAKLEYDFYDFGTSTLNFNTVATAGPMPVNIKSNVNVFTVGLNYRLNWVGGWH